MSADRVEQLIALGREHYNANEYEQAEPFLAEAASARPSFPDLYNMLGVVYHSQGRFQDAEEAFETALKLNPRYTEAALNLSVTYNDRGKYEKAREVYSKIKVGPVGTAQGLDPFARGKLANMHADIAQAYADAGLPREAIHEYEKATALCPQFADLQVKLGTLFREINDLPSARVHYEAALQAKPGYVPARLQLGVTLLALGDANGAEEQWREVIKLEAENSQAKMYLRMLERTRLSQPPKA